MKQNCLVLIRVQQFAMKRATLCPVQSRKLSMQSTKTSSKIDKTVCVCTHFRWQVMAIELKE